MSRRTAVFTCLLVVLATSASQADQAATFFDDSKVHEIRLYFDSANWYNTLYDAHANNPEDPYFPARFKYGDIVLPQIGARFKGNSSFRVNGVKKSFKLDFNEYADAVTFLGLKKLNLNNLSLSPDFMREKLFLDFAGKYIPAMRAVHVNVYVNDVLWGLYMAVEQPDKTMMQSRFGDTEDGNLYEAGEMNVDMTYKGTNPVSYTSLYELKTNETENDYSGLIEFLDVLNNTPTADLPAKLEPLCDVNNMLHGLALDILFSNTDSYLGSGSEFYLYDRTDTGQFIRIHWDLNESFGTTGDGSPSVANPMQMDPFWLPTSSGGPGGPGGPGGGGGTATISRPLATKLWAVESYKRTYLRMLARMLREGFDETTMKARIQQLADLIRSSVSADPNKLYTSAQFETALQSQVSAGQVPIYGLNQFVTGRHAFLRPLLNTYSLASDIRLNELVSVNAGSYKDAAGDADPWVELHNLGPGAVTLTGFTLTDDASNPVKWALPAVTLSDGGFLVIWLDGETAEGPDHASFNLQASGGTLSLHVTSGGKTTLLETVTYPALSSGQGLIRLGESGNTWAPTVKPSPGTANPASGSSANEGASLLRINELMANNDSTIADPDEVSAYEDWIEIYNPGTSAVGMGGLYLTDDLTSPTKWVIPQGVTIPAGGHLLFWADGETVQGKTHANFKLSADGEAVGLFQADGQTAIDSVVFGAQGLDVAYGRYPDGAATLTRLSPASPGSANQLSIWVPVASHAAGENSSQWRTDLGVLNAGTGSASLQFLYHAQDGLRTGTATVSPGSQARVSDIVAQLGTEGAAALEVRSDRPVSVTSRTYNLVSTSSRCTPGGTFGLDTPASLSADGLQKGQSAWLNPLAEDERFRTNIALTNTGTAKATVSVALFDGDGTDLTVYTAELAPGEWRQENRPLANLAGRTNLDRAYAKVTVTSGAGIIALGSVTDNITNDPTAVPMRLITEPAAGAELPVPGTDISALRINEVMADNGTAIVDPDEAGAFEDWIEIVNTGTTVVDMGGLYLTDDLANPAKWKIPAGVTVPSGGRILFFADGEESQGATHATFKLSADGEAVGLYQSDGKTAIDTVTFGALSRDVSYGRLPDATGGWAVLSPGTPGSRNLITLWVPAVSHSGGAAGSNWRSDVGLLNPGYEMATVEMRYHSGGGVQAMNATVNAVTQAIVTDVVDQFHLAGSGALEIRSDQLIHVTSRTYNLIDTSETCTPGGTLGLDVKSWAPQEGLKKGDSAFLTPLVEDASFRTNIALTNAGTEKAAVLVELFDGAMGAVSLGSYTVDLEAGEWKQEDRPFLNRAGRSDVSRGYAKVTVTLGSGVLPLAFVTDNATNDPTAVTTGR